MMEAFGECGVNMRATTIHAGLIPDRTGYDGRGWTFHYNERNHLPFKRVILDEGSMPDNATLCALFRAISPGTQVVLCGDPDQLPPVGKGKPFIDMINAGTIPHAKLTEVHRFAGRIAVACQAINQGRRIVASEKIDLSPTASECGPENLRHVERKDAMQSLQALEILIDRVTDMGFSPLSDVQVLVARNSDGGLNRESVNIRLQQLINPHGRSVKGCPFRIGDKAMCLKNGSYETYDVDGTARKTGIPAYVANGESGIVSHVHEKLIIVDFSGHHVGFTRAVWNSMVCLSYAITCHKSQGGGWPCVIYMIDNTRLVDRNLTYTAISRSKKLCLTVGEMSTMQRQIQVVKVDKRKTFMKEMLQCQN